MIDEEGGLARHFIEARTRRFCDRWEKARLQLYRQHLQASVVSASPLISRIAEDLDVPIEPLLWKLRPPGDWPQRCMAPARASKGSHYRSTRGPVVPRESTVFLRSRQRDHDPIRLCVSGCALEVSLSIGSALLFTGGGHMQVRINHALPASVTMAAVGRSVSDIVHHRWLDDPNWTVQSLQGAGIGTWIHVETGQEPYRMPWAASLDKLVRRTRT